MAIEGALAAAPGLRTPVEREVLKVEKKLREVDKLLQRRDAGETLDVLQAQKLSKGDELRKTLEELREQLAVEIASAPTQEIIPKDSVDDKELCEAPEQERAQQRKKFNAQCLEGDWLDNFGQRVIVSCGDTRRGARGAVITYTYTAFIRKTGVADKWIIVKYDAEKQEWRCGNGVLDRNSSTWDEIAWVSTTGRITTWSRAPPDGPIFFDAAPGAYEQFSQQEQGSVMPFVMDDGATYFDAAPGGYDAGQEAWMQGEWPQSMQAQPVCLVPVDDVFSQREGAVQDHALWGALLQDNAVGESGSSVLEPALPKPALFVCAPSDEVCISSNRLDWTLPDSWGKLRTMPTQSAVSSPVFDVDGSPGMQLEFYPNGKKTTEAGFCTLQLTRALESKVGIKFELTMNGRSNGPKACLGRRFLADYPMPFDSTSDSDSQVLTVRFLILDTF